MSYDNSEDVESLILSPRRNSDDDSEEWEDDDPDADADLFEDEVLDDDEDEDDEDEDEDLVEDELDDEDEDEEDEEEEEDDDDDDDEEEEDDDDLDDDDLFGDEDEDEDDEEGELRCLKPKLRSARTAAGEWFRLCRARTGSRRAPPSGSATTPWCRWCAASAFTPCAKKRAAPTSATAGTGEPQPS